MSLVIEYIRHVFSVTKMNCPICVSLIERELTKLDAVKNVRVNYLIKKIEVDYDPGKINSLELEEIVEKYGYRISDKKYDSIFHKVSKVFKTRVL